MKQLTIKRLKLANFKGIRALEVEFSPGVTTISGRNGTGKTTIKDAFSWLLWGKDSEGNADTKFGIKTNDPGGNFIPDLEHEVTGTFSLVDTDTAEEQEVELRRVLVEDWLTRKGETDRELKGHHTDYYVNGVPLATKREYDQRVSETIPEGVFKMITDPSTFLTLKWQAQREMLLTIAGEVRDGEIAGDNEAFNSLLAQLTGKTLEDYRKELAAKWKALAADIDRIPTRIDEAQRAIDIIIQPDYDKLEADKAALEAQLADIDEAAASAAAASRQAYEASALVQEQINGLKTRQQELAHQADRARREAQYQRQQRRAEGESNLRQAQQALKAATKDIEAKRALLTGNIDYYTHMAERITASTDSLRQRWRERNGETYKPGCMVCPRYGHRCQDPEAASKGEGEFYEKLAADLADISRQGREMNQQARGAREAAEAAKADLAEAESRHEARVIELEATQKQAEGALGALFPEQPQEAPEPITADPRWVQLQAEIRRLEAERDSIKAPGGDTAREEAARQKGIANTRLDVIKRLLYRRETTAAQRKRIEELNTQALKLAAERALVEHQQATADEFVRRRMAEVERRVNALFPTLRFKMYSDQINGEQKPDCVASIDGVRYLDLNTAKKINAGLEAINVLCNFHGYTAPIFIDNAESVNTLIKTHGQLIRLEVNTAEGLTVEKQ